jgi:Ca2+-binding RTX toxin-like protein
MANTAASHRSTTGHSGATANSIIGTAGDDVINGTSGSDDIQGLAGNDILIGGAGADTLNGGAGYDTASYANAAKGLVASLAAPSTNTGDAKGDTYVSIENLTGSNFNDLLSGNDGNNILDGGAGNDILSGDNGDDILIGGAGADELRGGTGHTTASYITATAGVTASLGNHSINTGDAKGDTYSHVQNLTGSNFDDVLIGDIDDSVLIGNAGNDRLDGNAGNDTLIGGAGADTLIGGAGNDTASYETATTGVTASLANVAVNTGDAAGDTYSSVENLKGSAFNDILIGDAGNNILQGGAGNDRLDGGAGDDRLTGGAGNDTFVIRAGSGHDTITDFASGHDVVELHGGSFASGADVLAAAKQSGADVIITIDGNDSITLQHVNLADLHATDFNIVPDVITGTDGDDILIGDAGNNVFDGKGGNDILIGNAGADTLAGGDGVDTASYVTAAAAVVANLADASVNTGDAAGDTYSSIENLTGSAFDDTLIGDAGHNVLDGGAGNDVLAGGAGADTLLGGDGINTASYETAASGVTANLADTSVNTGDAAGDTYSNISNLTGSAFDDVLTGDAGHNVLDGGAGNDVLIGGAGADTLLGGDGINTASYETATSGVTASLTDTSVNTGDAAGDTYSNISNLTGSAFDDVLTGDAGHNVLDGGAGNDVLIGGAGADTLIGGDGVNTASYETAISGVIANLADTSVNTGDAAGDTYSNISNLTGSAFDDVLTGDAGHNVLIGGAGNDTLDGGSGGDTLIGGTGNDTYVVHDAGDVIVENANEGTDTVIVDVDTYTLSANVENASAGLAIDTTIIGNELDNRIAGGVGNDTLSGGDGNDTLIGSGGINSLSGGNGDDMLVAGNLGDTLDGGAGNDLLIAGGGSDTLIGGDGIDTVSYVASTVGITASLDDPSVNTGIAAHDTYSSIENLTGSNFDDILTGGSNANTLDGGSGNDTLDGGAGDDVLTGGNGNDTFVIRAESGHDTIMDFVSGQDVIELHDGPFASGADALAAAIQSGDDVVITVDDQTSITLHDINLADLHAADFNLINDTVTGTDRDDILIGDEHSNILNGQGGNDILIGNGGGDTLNGGDGIDTASYATATVGVVASLTDPSVNTGDAAHDHYNSIENLTGSALNDTLVGDANNNVLEGGAGADALIGGGGIDTASYATATSGVVANLADPSHNTGDALGDSYSGIQNLTGSAFNDTLTGDAGNNVLIGGAGADALDGGAGNDTASYETAHSGVLASLATPSTNTGDAAGDTYANIENLKGTNFGDTLVGDNGDNILDGGDGVDTLSGGNGNDILIGGAGADQLQGGTGHTTASYVTATAGVTASLGNHLINTGDAAGDTYSHVQNLTGSNFNDTLIGDVDDTVLIGNAGDDVLDGGLSRSGFTGNDTLTGGAGNDTFVFRSGFGQANHDTITDFAPGQDVIELHDGMFANAAAALAAATQTGADVTITVDATDSLVLHNVALANLHATDFHVV